MLLKKALMLIASLTLIVFMSTTVAQAQQEDDGLAQVVLITAKDGQAKALEKAITGYHHYMADKEGAMRYQWFSITTGPDTGKYMARTGNHNWADFDATHDWNEKATAKFASDVQPYIEDAVFIITRTDDELGIWPDSMDGYKYFLVTDWYVKNGSNGAFNSGLKKIDGILKKADWPNYYAFIRNVSGGHSNQITLVSPRKSFADMEPKEPSFFDAMSSSMGEEEARAFLAEFGQTYKSGRNYMLKYRPKLSDYGDSK